MEGARRARENAPAPCWPRRPEDPLPYRTVQAHLATWLLLAGEGDGDPVPAHVDPQPGHPITNALVIPKITELDSQNPADHTCLGGLVFQAPQPVLAGDFAGWGDILDNG